MNSLRPRGFGWSEKGPFRAQNQDSFYFNDDLGLYIICDGMGGHADGKVAAELTVECIVSHCENHKGRILSAHEKSQPEEILSTILRDAVRRSASNVFEMSETYEQCYGMGTTVTALLISETLAVIAHVGDSRCLLFRDGKLSQLTTDHTLAQDLINKGVMTKDDLAKAPFAHALSKNIGQDRDVAPDIISEEIQLGDMFLLATDGLSGGKKDSESIKKVIGSTEVANIARDLSYNAVVNGSKDNVTALLVAIGEEAAQIPQSTLRAVA